MTELYCLIPSPRAGRRFINLYRLVRATIYTGKWEQFVGSEGSGEHRAVLLLLAMLIGYPSEAAEIFRRLIERVHNETWWEFIDSFQPRSGGPQGAEEWAELMAKLRSLRPLIGDTEGCDVFREYAPQVARYSFQSGRVLIAQRLPETDD